VVIGTSFWERVFELALALYNERRSMGGVAQARLSAPCGYVGRCTLSRA
jgi:hypothetical protein